MSERDYSVCLEAEDGRHVWGPEEQAVMHTLGGVIKEDMTECVACYTPRKYAEEKA